MPTPRRAAFTLIEILFVISLIAIVVGFAVTRFNYRGYRMDANIRLMQNVIIGAQQTAVTRNVQVIVMFDANAQRVRVHQDVTPDDDLVNEPARYYPLFDGAEFQAPSTTIDGAAAAYMTGPGVVERGNPLQLALRIAPNGSLSGDVVVYIGSTAREEVDQRAMTIVGATARTGFWSRAGGAWRARNN